MVWLSCTLNTVDTDWSPMNWYNNEAPLFDVPSFYFTQSKQDSLRHDAMTESLANRGEF